MPRTTRRTPVSAPTSASSTDKGARSLDLTIRPDDPLPSTLKGSSPGDPARSEQARNRASRDASPANDIASLRMTKRKRNHGLAVGKTTRFRISLTSTGKADRVASLHSPEEIKAALKIRPSLTVEALKERFPIHAGTWKRMLDQERNDHKGKVAEPTRVHHSFRRFRDFLRKAPPCPGPGHTLDRINVHDKEYAREKTRWATSKEQANNRTTTHFLTFDGERLPLTEVARRTGQRPDTMRLHLRQSWSEAEVVAGHRIPADATPEVQPMDGWPSGATISAWERHYDAWADVMGREPGATRPVFFAWIIKNRLRDLYPEKLAKAFPEFFDSDLADPSDEDEALPAHVTSSSLHVSRQRSMVMLSQAMAAIGGDPGQLGLLARLGFQRWKVLHPGEARKGMLAEVSLRRDRMPRLNIPVMSPPPDGRHPGPSRISVLPVVNRAWKKAREDARHELMRSMPVASSGKIERVSAKEVLARQATIDAIVEHRQRAQAQEKERARRAVAKSSSAARDFENLRRGIALPAPVAIDLVVKDWEA